MFSATFQAEDTKCGANLVLNGAMSIESADALKQALIQALDGADGLVIDLDGVTGLDETGLQLICAAHKAALKQKKSFRLVPENLPLLIEIMIKAGFHCSLCLTGLDSTEQGLWFAPDLACKGGMP